VRNNVPGLPKYYESQLRVTEENLELGIPENNDQNPVHLFFINENNLQGCPRVKVSIGKQEIAAILDCGSQMSLITEELYNKLISNRVESLEMPIQNAILVSAFGNRTRRIKQQAMLEVTIQEDVFGHVFLVSSQLVTSLILGMNYLLSGNVVMRFKEATLLMNEMVSFTNTSLFVKNRQQQALLRT
jgi:hypothetical protein